MKDRKTINEIMKSHKPWTVGVRTNRSNNSVFYPVIYNRAEKKWYGYINQWVNGIEENIGACRNGNTKRWSVVRTNKKRLPDDDSVTIWLKDVFI